MSNAIKAYALLALLIGLTLFAGELLGGRDGLLIAFVISFGMSFISYWFSDSIVLTMYGARRVHPDQYPTLHAMVRDLAARAGIPTPALYIIPSSSPNAFATGRGPSHAAVAVTEGIVALLTPEELSGVLAHEIAHIANYDVLLSTLVAVLAGSLSFLSRMVMWEILACLSFPKTLMSQGRGQRIFSARSRPPGPFQPFCLAPKTEVFTRQ